MALGYTFEEFFRELNGFDPFPWQSKLAAQVVTDGWPSPIAVPTAGGKTATLEIALWTLASGSPHGMRRIFFVVDRRVVVDQAAKRARDIAKLLHEKRSEASATGAAARALLTLGGEPEYPLRTVTLRGGMLRDTSWAESPLQPLIACSTVDQVGSALLFRSYSASSNAWPIHAGLIANDALFLLDEAHLSRPFVETVQAMARLGTGCRMAITELSATPGASIVFTAGDEDSAHPVLGPRLNARKPARLEEAKAEAFEDAAAAEASQFLAEGFRSIGVIVNRVGSARAIFESLRSAGDVRLLTGRSRSLDRDKITEELMPRLRGEIDGPPLIVVATQCLEAGADLTFDALVTEAAPLDALRQRFGRLNRYGTTASAPAVILLRKATQKEDPIYGSAVKTTWEWLNQRTVAETGGKKKQKAKKTVDFGALAMGAMVSEYGLAVRDLLAPPAQASILLPAYLDHLCQTSPEPSPEINLSVFLHGPQQGKADVNIVWRNDLEAGLRDEEWIDLVAMMPPSSPETLAVPIFAARAWLQREPSPMELADMETTAEDASRGRGDKPTRALVWRGPEQSTVIGRAEDLRPGMTLVIPAEYGGCDEFGWNPASKNPVTDIAEEAYEKARGRRAVRIPISSKAGVDEESVKKYLTEDSDPLANQRFRVLAHPFATLDDGSSAAGLALGTATRPSSPEPFERDDQSDDGASISKAVSLVDHQSHVESELRRFLDRLPELAEFRETLLQAARWHDLGKADPRFQLMLYRGNAIEAAAGGLRAKSDGERADRALYNRLRAYSGYPKGGRHELLSMSIVESLQTPEEVDRDLLLHLIATHHGRCRPFAPWIKDDAPPMVSVPVDGERITRTAEHGLHEIGSGVAERFWRLTRRLQPHRLAFVESLLRLADQLASRKEREGVWKI